MITQTDSSLTISPRERTSYTLFFDGRDVVMSDSVTRRAVTLNGRWHGKQFEVRRTLPSRMQLLESYEIKRNGRRLVIHIKPQREGSNPMMGGVPPVYDRYGR